MSPLAIHALFDFQSLAYPNLYGIYARNQEAIRELRQAGMIQTTVNSCGQNTSQWEITKRGRDFAEQLQNTVPTSTVEISQMDETVQRMSLAFAEKVSKLEVIGRAHV